MEGRQIPGSRQCSQHGQVRTDDFAFGISGIADGGKVCDFPERCGFRVKCQTYRPFHGVCGPLVGKRS